LDLSSNTSIRMTVQSAVEEEIEELEEKLGE